LKSPDSVKFGDYTRSHPAPRVINTDKHAGYLHLRSQGTETKPEDVARLSPLADKHFNVLGRYLFTVTDSILRGDSALFAFLRHRKNSFGQLALSVRFGS
jgi:Tn3 transposase DDE domain